MTCTEKGFEPGQNKAAHHQERFEVPGVQHMPTMFQRPDRITQPLDVILTVFNNARWRSRWKLYEDFVRHAEASGQAVRIWTVEVIFGRREAAVTNPHNPRHLQLHTASELWHKERSQNLLVQNVLAQHPEAEYFAFVDADVTFARADWADETRHALQHFDVVQMWRDAYDLDGQGNIIQQHKSFAACRADGEPPLDASGLDYYYGGQAGKRVYWHPGYAWAWRRHALEGVGGLIDHAILGSADFHMAHALVGQLGITTKRALTPAYVSPMERWQQRAVRHVKHNVGVMNGSLLHHWHGRKADRKYKTRWQILEATQFDPTTDLAVDAQGLYRFEHAGELRHNDLRDQCRAYFAQRDEDATS